VFSKKKKIKEIDEILKKSSLHYPVGCASGR